MNKIDVGGVPVTLEEIREARQKLAATGGTAIKQVLGAKDIQSPLASCDYWGEIKAALAVHPELEVPSQSPSDHAQRAKIVFDFVLAGKEAVLSGEAVPDTADYAYTPPARGGEVPKSRVFETDPDKMDRGTTAHKDTQDALAEALRKAGLKPRSPRLGDPAFDIAWRDDAAGGTAFICEVKSLTGENETGQIRLAVGQVLDYVHALDSLREAGSLPPHWEGIHAVRAVVAVERRPANDAHWTGLCERHGIILTWPRKYAGTLAALAPAGLCDTEFRLCVTLESGAASMPCSCQCPKSSALATRGNEPVVGDFGHSRCPYSYARPGGLVRTRLHGHAPVPQEARPRRGCMPSRTRDPKGARRPSYWSLLAAASVTCSLDPADCSARPRGANLAPVAALARAQASSAYNLISGISSVNAYPC